PLARAGANGVGGDADADPRVAQLLEVAQVLGNRRLAKPVDPAAGVGDIEDDELDPDLPRGVDRRPGFVEAEGGELADGGEARLADLREDRPVVRANVRRELEHPIAPGPEIAALDLPAQRPLERVAVRIHETGDLEIVRHPEEDKQQCCDASWSWGWQG